jgi:tetratricopeptide (TPR) repeat protein
MWLVALQFNQGEPKLIEHAVRSLELARKAGERFHLAWDLIEFSYLFYRYGRTDEARKHLEEAEKLSKQISSNTNSITFVFAQINLARIEWLAGNHQQARALLIESQAHLRLLGERQMSSSCSELLGLLSMEEGDLNQAQAYLEEALSTTQELETNFILAKRLVLSILFYLQGDIKKSRQYLRESISLTKDLSPYRKVYFLESLFVSPYFQMPDNSVRLLGAICRHQKKKDIPMEPLFKRFCVQAEAQARETLGEAAFESEFAEGQQMSLDEALDFALITVEEM